MVLCVEKALWTCISGGLSTSPASPVMKSCGYLKTLAKTRSTNVGASHFGQDDFWGAMVVLQPQQHPNANKTSVSNHNTGFYLKIISWRKIKPLLSLQSCEGRKVHLRLLKWSSEAQRNQRPLLVCCIPYSWDKFMKEWSVFNHLIWLI